MTVSPGVFDPDQTRRSEVDYGTTAAGDVPGPASLVLVMSGVALVLGRRLLVLFGCPGQAAGKRR